MSDTPVYVMGNLIIKDKEEYQRYEKGFFPLLKRHGGEFITLDDNVRTLEGTGPEGRLVLFRFPSEEAAGAWYADEDYQTLSKHRRSGTDTGFLIMIHGPPQREV